MGNRNAKNTTKNSLSSDSMDRQNHDQMKQISLLRSISAYSRLSINANAVGQLYFFFFLSKFQKIHKYTEISNISMNVERYNALNRCETTESFNLLIKILVIY